MSSKVEEIDENNANYTISAQLNGSSWIYLLVPVYAEPEDNSFVVSGSPSFVSPPATAKYSPPMRPVLQTMSCLLRWSLISITSSRHGPHPIVLVSHV